MHPLYEIVLKDTETDIRQMVEEGHDDVSLFAELSSVREKNAFEALAAFQEELWQRPSPPDFAYEEPDDWETIAAGFPDPDLHARFSGDEQALADRLLAAWQGRCAGCQLGKPIEGTMWPDKIRTVLELVGSWPLDDYMNPAPAGMTMDQLPDCDFFQRNNEWRNTLCKGNFDHVAPDDDIHYAIISQLVLEMHGADFTSEQALDALKNHLPISCLWASGRNMFRTSTFGVPSPWTARMGNPCRQSLGAQIRCDPFGWGAPANPALAAKWAYRDAVNSQVRNGIYSGVFFAVLLADVLAHGNPVAAIDTAEAYVPPKSRFAEMICFIKDRCANSGDWLAVNDAMLERYPVEAGKFNHAIPNAAIVIMGLLMGGGDFTRTLGITVMAGLDTDCTGATVGSIMGCALGTSGIPANWTEPFHDTIRSDVKGMPEVKISELAARMFDIAVQHARWK